MLLEFFLKCVFGEGLHEIIGDTGLDGLHHLSFFGFGNDHDNGYVLV